MSRINEQTPSNMHNPSKHLAWAIIQPSTQNSYDHTVIKSHRSPSLYTQKVDAAYKIASYVYSGQTHLNTHGSHRSENAERI